MYVQPTNVAFGFDPDKDDVQDQARHLRQEMGVAASGGTSLLAVDVKVHEDSVYLFMDVLGRTVEEARNLGMFYFRFAGRLISEEVPALKMDDDFYGPASEIDEPDPVASPFDDMRLAICRDCGLREYQGFPDIVLATQYAHNAPDPEVLATCSNCGGTADMPGMHTLKSGNFSTSGFRLDDVLDVLNHLRERASAGNLTAVEAATELEKIPKFTALGRWLRDPVNQGYVSFALTIAGLMVPGVVDAVTPEPPQTVINIEQINIVNSEELTKEDFDRLLEEYRDQQEP